MKRRLIDILLIALCLTGSAQMPQEEASRYSGEEFASPLKVAIVSQTEGVTFAPGEWSEVYLAVSNEGRQRAHIFVRAEHPESIYDYQLADGWEEVEPGVWYGGVLEAGETSGQVFEGVMVTEEAVENGMTELSWEMVGYCRTARGDENGEEVWEGIEGKRIFDT